MKTVSFQWHFYLPTWIFHVTLALCSLVGSLFLPSFPSALKREECLGNTWFPLSGLLPPLHHDPEAPLPSLQLSHPIPCSPQPLWCESPSPLLSHLPQPGLLLLSHLYPSAAFMPAHAHQPASPPSLLCHHSENLWALSHDKFPEECCRLHSDVMWRKKSKELPGVVSLLQGRVSGLMQSSESISSMQAAAVVPLPV